MCEVCKQAIAKNKQTSFCVRLLVERQQRGKSKKRVGETSYLFERFTDAQRHNKHEK